MGLTVDIDYFLAVRDLFGRPGTIVRLVKRFIEEIVA